MSGTVAVTVTKDQILDGMVTALAPSLQTATPAGRVRNVARYMGKLDTATETFQRGVVGRCPAVLVGFDGERSLRTTIGRRVDRVEGTYLAVCCTDSDRSRDDRKRILAVLEDVRRLVAARRYSLQMRPMFYQGTRTIIDNERLLAIAAVFTSRYRVDYTKSATYVEMSDANGQIVYDHDTLPEAPVAPTVTQVGGAAGTTRHAYAVEALFGTNPRSNLSPWGETLTGAASLGAASMLITWTAVTDATLGAATGYRIWRIDSPSSLGVIATLGAVTTYTDDGTNAGDGSVPPTRGVGVDVDALDA